VQRITESNGSEVFTDATWVVWEPLSEEVRPYREMPPKELRRTISALLWRHQNGAKWRSIPGDLGPGWLAAQLFIRWAKAGVWQSLLELVQQQGVALAMTFIDGTNIRAHHKSAGAKKGGRWPGVRPARSIWPVSRWLWHQGSCDRRQTRKGHCLCSRAWSGA
jgi:transposase